MDDLVSTPLLSPTIRKKDNKRNMCKALCWVGILMFSIIIIGGVMLYFLKTPTILKDPSSLLIDPGSPQIMSTWKYVNYGFWDPSTNLIAGTNNLVEESNILLKDLGRNLNKFTIILLNEADTERSNMMCIENYIRKDHTIKILTKSDDSYFSKNNNDIPSMEYGNLTSLSNIINDQSTYTIITDNVDRDKILNMYKCTIVDKIPPNIMYLKGDNNQCNIFKLCC